MSLSRIPAISPPGDTRRALPERVRHALGRLADYLQVANDGILNHRSSKELISARLRISERPINGVTHVE